MTGGTLMTIAFATFAAAVACGDDDGGNPDEQQIISISRNAVYAWIDAGADGLTDYLAESATVLCSPDALQQSLDDYGTPGDWSETTHISFVRVDEATATVVLETEDGLKEEKWSFLKVGESWRVSEIGGVMPCKVPAI